MSTHKRPDDVEGLAVQKAKPKLKRPSMYKVYLLNDDYTPMDFVVEILVQVFTMDHAKAVQTMLQVHHSGRGLCGVFSRDVAETKVLQVMDLAHAHEFPLMCKMEPDKD